MKQAYNSLKFRLRGPGRLLLIILIRKELAYLITYKSKNDKSNLIES